MKLASLVAVVALAACGGGSKNAPAAAEPGPAGEEPGDPAGDPAEAEPTEEAELDTEGYCCCALPSDPETYERIQPDACHTDSHGVCTELAQCGE